VVVDVVVDVVVVVVDIVVLDVVDVVVVDVICVLLILSKAISKAINANSSKTLPNIHIEAQHGEQQQQQQQQPWQYPINLCIYVRKQRV